MLFEMTRYRILFFCWTCEVFRIKPTSSKAFLMSMKNVLNIWLSYHSIFEPCWFLQNLHPISFIQDLDSGYENPFHLISFCYRLLTHSLKTFRMKVRILHAGYYHKYKVIFQSFLFYVLFNPNVFSIACLFFRNQSLLSYTNLSQQILLQSSIGCIFEHLSDPT